MTDDDPTDATEPSPGACLRDLGNELRAWTGFAPTGRWDMLAAELPLLHRTSTPERLLGEPSLIPGDGAPSRAVLGTSGCVFFWVGRQSYDARLVLVWEASVEQGPPDGFGAPWDTGGLMSKGTLGTTLDAFGAREAIARYSLPLGEYREYLSMVIETCFAEPSACWDVGGRPTKWYPGYVRAPDQIPELPAQTFEVRRAGPVEVGPGLLAAVADESWFCDQPRVLRELKQVVRRHRATWWAPRPAEPPHVAAMRFVEDFLRKRGLA